MMMLIEIALVLGGLALAARYVFRGSRDADRTTITNRRVEAYMTTIRRENSNAELAAMTDLELRDILLSGARNLKIDRERRVWVIAGAAALALVAAVVIATEEGIRGFGIAALVGALAIYGINEYLSRRIREPLRRLGIDAERLRVE